MLISKQMDTLLLILAILSAINGIIFNDIFLSGYLFCQVYKLDISLTKRSLVGFVPLFYFWIYVLDKELTC